MYWQVLYYVLSFALISGAVARIMQLRTEKRKAADAQDYVSHQFGMECQKVVALEIAAQNLTKALADAEKVNIDWMDACTKAEQMHRAAGAEVAAMSFRLQRISADYDTSRTCLWEKIKSRDVEIAKLTKAKARKKKAAAKKK